MFVGITRFSVSVCVPALFVFVGLFASLLHRKVTEVTIRSANLLVHAIQRAYKPVKERKVWETWVKRWRTVVDIVALVHSVEFWELKQTPTTLPQQTLLRYEEWSQSSCNSPVYFPSLCMSKRVHKHFIKIQWDQSSGFRRLIISFEQQPLNSRLFLCSHGDCLAKGWDFEPVPQKRLSTKPDWTEEWWTDDAQKEVIASWLKFTCENVRGKCMQCVITRHTSDTSDPLILMLK